MEGTKIILYSCGSDIIVDYIEVCAKNNIGIKSIINNLEKEIVGFENSPISVFDFKDEHSPFLVPLFTPYNRFLAVQEALNHGLIPYSLLNDRNNDLPINFKHGVGCFINKRVVIGSHSAIGEHVLINRGACLGHHLLVENFVSIGPGVITGGNVTLKRGSMIGTGAVIAPSVTVGEHAVIGAGAVVTKNVENNSVVIGNPAIHIKSNKNVF